MPASLIFISYAREDAVPARRLFGCLKETEEFSPWLDQENLLPGVEWESAILEALKDSRFIILLLSQRAVNKAGFIQKEIREAIDRFSYYPPGSIFLIPARLDDCRPLHPALREIQWVDLFPDWEAGLVKLIAALRQEIAVTLGDRFEQLKRCRYAASHCRQTWINANVDLLSRMPYRSVLECLDAKFTSYMDELFAIETMAILAHSSSSESLADYVFRAHEIVKNLKYPYEWYSGYGVLLNVSRLLAPAVRTVLLRDIYTNNIGFLQHTFRQDTSWAEDLVLLEVTKHYLTQSVAMYEGARDIAMRAIRVMSWDIPYLELVAFLAARDEEIESEFVLLRLLNDGFIRAGRGNGSDASHSIVAPLPSDPPLEHGARAAYRVSFEPAAGADLWRTDDGGEARRFANYRENYSRLGLSLRLSEYMLRTDDRELRIYWRALQENCLVKLRDVQPQVAAVLSSVVGDERRRLFDCIERQRATELARWFPQKAELKAAMDLVKECCYQQSWETGELSRVPIEDGRIASSTAP
jgi:hypothetical protein